MKKLILITFALLIAIAGLTSGITSQAVDTPKGATLNDFNPFGGKDGKGGINCLYSFSGTKKGADPGIAGRECSAETGLLNRIEQLMYIIAPSFAVLGIMLGGYKMMQDGYDAKGEGMKTIRGSIIGLIIVLSAFFVRNFIYTFFNSTFKDDNSLSIDNEAVKNIVGFLNTIAYQFLVPIGSPIAVGFVIWGGYLLITAGGNQKQINDGTKTIKNAIIGFLIIVFAAAIISIAQNLLGSFYGTVVAPKKP